MKRTTKLTIETERVFVVRQSRVERRGRCEACQEVVCLLTADEAARLAGVSARAIYRMVEADKIHFTETADALLLICFNSLCHSLFTADGRSPTDNSNWKGEKHESDE